MNTPFQLSITSNSLTTHHLLAPSLQNPMGSLVKVHLSSPAYWKNDPSKHPHESFPLAPPPHLFSQRTQTNTGFNTSIKF